MEWNKEVVDRVRGAMRDRARVLACMCDELFAILPADEAEKKGAESHNKIWLYQGSEGRAYHHSGRMDRHSLPGYGRSF